MRDMTKIAIKGTRRVKRWWEEGRRWLEELGGRPELVYYTSAQ